METDSADKSDSAGFMPYDESRPPLPSKVPYNELQPILISQMQPQTYHLGRRTVVQVVPPTIRHKDAILATVRDEAGTMLGVQLQATCQPFEEVVPTEQILRDSCWYLIKEPMALLNEKGNLRLVVEHPGDIILLRPYHELIPGDSRISKDVFVCVASSGKVRLKGNDAVGRKSWAEAENLYSIAIETAETAQEAGLAYLNRSLANLRLGRPALALADAIKSNATGTPTEKSLFREASALYDLSKFDQCLNKLQALTTAFPTNTSAISMIDRVQERLKEQQTGQYDFRRMYKQARATPPLIDCATYTAPLEIRDSPGKGRGVFTKRKVLAGELLSCEKAFSYVYGGSDRPGHGNMTIFDVKDELQTHTVQKMFHNIEDARLFAQLHHHGDYDAFTADEVDGKPVIDSYFVRRVLDLRTNGAPRTSLSLLRKFVAEGSVGVELPPTIMGMWSFNSHVNHSCISNIKSSIIGDMQIIRAAKDLGAGTEIFLSYEYPVAFESYDKMQERLSRWGFKCNCAICRDRQATPKQIHMKRDSLRMQLRLLQSMRLGASNTSKARQLLDQLDQTYHSSMTQRPGTVIVEVWPERLALGKAFFVTGNFSEAVEMILKGLEALGFVISASPRGIARNTPEPELRILQWGLAEAASIDAFRVLFLAYKFIAPQNAPAVKRYMEIMYTMIVGENETFLETCPEVV